MITEPGVYPSLDEMVYHGDSALAPHLGRSLSYSGAKVLLESPARYAYQRTHRVEKPAFDFGHLAHALILGVSQGIRVIDCYDWKLKRHQDERKEAYAAGLIPVSRADLLAASRLARAVKLHPVAGRLFAQGKSEVSMYWIDPDTGVTCRGRVDSLHPRAVLDLKTCRDASPTGFAKDVASFHYELQDAFYRNGIRATTGEDLPFIFICVEKEPPHFVGLYQLDHEATRIGEEEYAEALALFAECEARRAAGDPDAYPGLSPEIQPLSLPRWAVYAHDNRSNA